MITATTVAEVLAALAANMNAEIEINASVAIDLELFVGSPILRLIGKTFLRLTTKPSSRAHVVARGSSHVVARGSSHVEAWESSHVVAWESSHVVARESSHVVARESSHVVARGSSHVEARESSHVEAWESSHVVAWGSSHVVARGSSHVEARESSHVVARGSSHVVAWGSSHVVARGSSHVEAWAYAQIQIASAGVRAKATANVAVLLRGGGKADGGRQTTVDISTAEKWCEYYGLDIVDGVVVLYKALNEDFTSPHGMGYAPGVSPKAPDWNPEIECGGGLHFSPCPVMALAFHTAGTRFAGCPIRVDEIVVHPNGQYLEKVKAPRCGPCFEVDRNGEPVAGVIAPTTEMVLAALPRTAAEPAKPAPKAKKSSAPKRKAKALAKRGGKK